MVSLDVGYAKTGLGDRRDSPRYVAVLDHDATGLLKCLGHMKAEDVVISQIVRAVRNLRDDDIVSYFLGGEQHCVRNVRSGAMIPKVIPIDGQAVLRQRSSPDRSRVRLTSAVACVMGMGRAVRVRPRSA